MARTQNEKDRDESIMNILSAILKSINKMIGLLENKNARK